LSSKTSPIALLCGPHPGTLRTQARGLTRFGGILRRSRANGPVDRGEASLLHPLKVPCVPLPGTPCSGGANTAAPGFGSRVSPQRQRL
jgi:hypothetical protein